MNVSREVIVDLLPVYLADEASPATRTLVEEYLKQDVELAQKVRAQQSTNFPIGTAFSLPPDLELKSLRRTRKMLGWQRWLFGLGIFFTAISATSQINTQGWRIVEFHLLVRDYPLQFGICIALAVACWSGYWIIRRRLSVH